MLNLSFSDFFKTRSWIMKEMAMMEMAKGAENVPKAKVLMDQDDLDFLHQFPTNCPKYREDNIWMLALRWRYSEGLLQVAKFWEEELGRSKEDPGQAYDKKLNEQFPNVQTVHLVKWSGGRSRKQGIDKGAIDVEDQEKEEAGISKIQRIYEFSGIKTEAVKLWEKLQDPDGPFNFDLTMAYDWAYQERDALHQFNKTAGALQQEASDRNLRAWLLANHHDVIKPVSGGKKVSINFGGPEKNPTNYNLQGIKLKFPGYKVYDFGGGKGRPTTDPAKLKAIAASQKPASEYGLSNFAGAITGMVKKVVDVPASEEVVPVLAGGTLLEPIPTNKKDTLLAILGFQDPYPSLLKLVQMYLIDPTDHYPKGGRTADNLIKTIEPHLEELDLSRAWFEEIKKYLKEAEDASVNRGALAKARRGRASTDPEEIKKKMGNLNLGNLIIAMNPKFTQNAWRNPARADPGHPFRFTAEEDIANLLSNWELLSDKSKATLQNSPSGTDLLKIQRDMQTGAVSTNRYWTLGGWDLSKAEFLSIGQTEFDKIFNKDEQALLFFRNGEVAFKKIRFCSTAGVKLGPRPILQPEADICKQESSVEHFYDSGMAMDIARKAVLTPHIMGALQNAGYDTKNPSSSASRAAANEVASKFLVPSSRIDALLGARLKAMTRIKTVSADASTSPSQDGGEGLTLGSVIDADKPAASGTSAAAQLHRRVSSTESGTGKEERGTQKAIIKDIQFLMANKEAAISFRNQIIDTKGKSESIRNIKELMKLEPTLKRRSYTLKSNELDELIDLIDQGVSEQDLIEKFMPGELADIPKIVASLSSLEEAESLEYYTPQPQNSQQKRTGVLERELITLSHSLTMDGGNLSSNYRGKTIDLRKEIEGAFSEGKPEEIVKHRIARYLELIKEYFEKEGFPKDLLEKRWKDVISQIRDAIENKGKLPIVPTAPTAPAPAAAEPSRVGGSLKSFLQRKKQPESPETTSATSAAPTPVTTATDPAKAEWRAKQAATVKRIHALLGSNSPQLRAIAQNPDQVKLISGLRKHLSVSHPEQIKQVDDILRYFATQGIQVETSVVMGYPPYTKIKKALQLSKINAWGTPGADYVATPDEGPIMQKKKKSLKEYLDTTKTNEHALYQDCIKRLKERVNGK